MNTTDNGSPPKVTRTQTVVDLGTVRRGEIVQCPAYVQEEEHLDLPRIAFTHTRRDYGTVRRLIDRINDMAIDSGAAPQPLAPPQPADRARVLNWRSHRISTLRARPWSR